MLVVELVAYETADFGVTAVIPGFGFLAGRLPGPVPRQVGDRRRRRALGGASGRRRARGCVRRGHRRRAVARRDGACSAAASRRSPTRGGPVAESVPERAFPPSAASGLRTIPPRETGGNMDIRGLVAGSRLFLPVARARRALLDRRPPLRPGRRRGVRDGDRGRGRSDRAASSSTRARAGGRATPPTRRRRRPVPRSFATTGIPVRRPDGPERGRARGAARDDRLPRVELRPVAAGGLRALQRRRRPAASPRSSTSPIRSSRRCSRSTCSPAEATRGTSRGSTTPTRRPSPSAAPRTTASVRRSLREA